jgi:hypothetical protein
MDWKRWMPLAATLLATGCASIEPDAENDLAPNEAGIVVASDAGNTGSDGGTQPGPTPTDAGVGALDAARQDAASMAGPDAQASSDAAQARDDAAQPSKDAAQLDAAPAADGGVGPVPVDPNACSVQPIPEELRTSYKMGAIYKRYASAGGVPVIASEKPPDETVRRACLLILDYATVSEKIQAELIKRKVRFIIMAKSEKTVDFPEYVRAAVPDSRARGLGGVTDGICAEESIMCDTATDRWRGESICVHEYAHTMHLGVWSKIDPTFETRLNAAFKAAQAAGTYTNTYAASSAVEYIAEGVQNWYNTNIGLTRPNGVHNHINTREELRMEDPMLYALLSEVLKDKPSYKDCYYYGP